MEELHLMEPFTSTFAPETCGYCPQNDRYQQLIDVNELNEAKQKCFGQILVLLETGVGVEVGSSTEKQD